MTKLRIVTDFGVSKWIEAYIGIMQGSRISPTIFTMAIDNIINTLNGRHGCIFKAYADDIVVIGPRRKAIIRRAVLELGRMLRDVSLVISEEKLEWTRFGGYNAGTKNLTLRSGLTLKKKNKIKIVGYWIKDTQEFNLKFHLKQRKLNSPSLKDDISIQRYIKKSIVLDMSTRKILFLGRFVQKYYYGGNVLAGKYIESRLMNEKYNANWYENWDLGEEIVYANTQLVKDSLVLVDGHNYARNLAANLLLKPIHMKYVKDESIFRFWINNVENETAYFQLENIENLIHMAKNKTKSKYVYKIVKFYSGHIESMVHYFNSIESSYPHCSYCNNKMDMDCFYEDERPCIHCGIWLKGKFRSKRSQVGEEYEVMDQRMMEIFKSEWGTVSKQVKVGQLFQKYSIWDEVKQAYTYQDNIYQEYMQYYPKDIEDYHIEYNDYDPDDFVHNYDQVGQSNNNIQYNNNYINNEPELNCIEAYTDGSSSARAHLGGIGIIFPNADIENVSEPVLRRLRTNNVSELVACIRALELIYEKYNNSIVRINTDSEYLINSIYYYKIKYRYKLNQLKMRNEDERKVKNIEIIEEIFNKIESKNEENELINYVCFRKVKAHVPNPEEDSPEFYNAMADNLAKEALRRQIREEDDNIFEENNLSDPDAPGSEAESQHDDDNQDDDPNDNPDNDNDSGSPGHDPDNAHQDHHNHDQDHYDDDDDNYSSIPSDDPDSEQNITDNNLYDNNQTNMNNINLNYKYMYQNIINKYELDNIYMFKLIIKNILGNEICYEYKEYNAEYYYMLNCDVYEKYESDHIYYMNKIKKTSLNYYFNKEILLNLESNIVKLRSIARENKLFKFRKNTYFADKFIMYINNMRVYNEIEYLINYRSYNDNNQNNLCMDTDKINYHLRRRNKYVNRMNSYNRLNANKYIYIEEIIKGKREKRLQRFRNNTETIDFVNNEYSEDINIRLTNEIYPYYFI